MKTAFIIFLLIIAIANILTLVYFYSKLKNLFRFKITEDNDGYYSIKYDNKEIYNAKPSSK